MPLAVAEQRKRARTDRGPGGAAVFYHLVHAHGLYDLELDTSLATPLECARRIEEARESRRSRTAFRQLATTLAG
jgi:chloramphenicol 3-O phosphotransferase